METPRLAARLAKEQTASANPSLPKLTSPRYRGSSTTSAADPNQDRPWPTRNEKTLRTKCRPLGALGGEFWAVEDSCELSTHAEGRLLLGDRVFLNYGSSISAHSLVRVGDDCKIGQYSTVMDCDWHELETPTHDGGHGQPRPVVLEAGVWLGVRVTVLKGVTIGRGSVIGAGSVVASDIPEGVVAAGVPARVLRALPFKATRPGGEPRLEESAPL